jgi:hypothetical protein
MRYITGPGMKPVPIIMLVKMNEYLDKGVIIPVYYKNTLSYRNPQGY